MTGAIGEELGWRGFLLPCLGKQVGVTASLWVMGILWSLWHLPAFFTPGMPHQLMPVVLVLPFVAFFGVFMGFCSIEQAISVLPTMSAHLSLNIMQASAERRSHHRRSGSLGSDIRSSCGPYHYRVEDAASSRDRSILIRPGRALVLAREIASGHLRVARFGVGQALASPAMRNSWS